MKGIKSVLILFVMLSLVSCVMLKELVVQANEEPVQTETAPVQTKKVPASGDYFPAGVKLAAGAIHSFTGNLCEVEFYTVTVVKEPSEATKGDGLVRVTWEESDPQKQEYWTPYIADTRPAKEEDLIEGVLVFAVGDTYGRTPEKLAASTHWRLGRIKDVSNLYKGIVITEYYDAYWNEWKERHFHKNNIRAIVGEFSEELRKK